MKNPKSIRALFAFPGFNASSKLAGKFGDRYARVIQLKRRKKQPSVVTVVSAAAGVTTRRCCGYNSVEKLGVEASEFVVVFSIGSLCSG